MKKTLLLASLALPLSLAACAPAAPSDDAMMDDGSSSAMMDDSMMKDDDAMMKDDDSMMNDDDSMMKGDDATAMEARVVPVLLTDWSFSPATVTVKQGEKVKLELKGDKGIHSLLVADLGLNVRVEPGSNTVVDLPTDKPGTYEGRCGVPCGPGHRDMKFTIVVE